MAVEGLRGRNPAGWGLGFGVGGGAQVKIRFGVGYKTKLAVLA